MKCNICEEDLEIDPDGYSMTSGPILYCANAHCDVHDPTDYKIKTEGFLFLKLKKPLALSAEGWSNWDKLAKKTHPIRYYLSDTVVPFFSRIRYRTLSSPYDWIRYRTYNRYHRVSTGLEPGWSDVDSQMIHTNFTMLVDFIEIEKAACMLWTDGEVNTHKWYHKGPFDNWRDANLGVKHLQWEMGLIRDSEYGLKEGEEGFGEPTRQALSAKEQYELYTWWKEVRPIRPEAMDACGLSAYYDSIHKEGTSFMQMLSSKDKDPVAQKAMMDMHTKIEEGYNQEDLAMLIRLMTIRQSLWS